MKTLSVLAILVLSFLLTSGFTGTIKEAPFETISIGIDSRYMENNRQHVIEIYDHVEWEKFWDMHVSGISPRPELPEVDFHRYAVIISMDEIRESGGYTLEIKEIKVDTSFENRPFTVILQSSQPGSACGTSGALTRPYHIVKIDRGKSL